MATLRRISLWMAGLAALGILAMAAGCQSRSPALGVVAGKLTPCPDSPNCVSSYEASSPARIAPFPLAPPAPDALRRLKAVVLKEPRTRLIDESPGYLRFEFRTALFRFVDDVEFLADEPAKVIHVRSASRVGYSDLGLNRRRVERLRQEYLAASAEAPASATPR